MRRLICPSVRLSVRVGIPQIFETVKKGIGSLSLTHKIYGNAWGGVLLLFLPGDASPGRPEGCQSYCVEPVSDSCWPRGRGEAVGGCVSHPRRGRAEVGPRSGRSRAEVGNAAGPREASALVSPCEEMTSLSFSIFGMTRDGTRLCLHQNPLSPRQRGVKRRPRLSG